MGFDPFVVDNWRNRTPQLKAYGVCVFPTHAPLTLSSFSNKGGVILSRYKGGIQSLLADTFPKSFEGKEQPTQQHSPPPTDANHIRNNNDIWDDTALRRQFLIAFANKEGFDPSLPENWSKKRIRLRSFGVNGHYPPPRWSFPKINTLVSGSTTDCSIWRSAAVVIGYLTGVTTLAKRCVKNLWFVQTNYLYRSTTVVKAISLLL